MAAVGQRMELGLEQLRYRLRGVDRNRIAGAVENHGGHRQARKRRPEIEVIQTGPHLLLGPAGYPKRGEVTGASWIEEQITIE